jgi:hypothetical protein
MLVFDFDLIIAQNILGARLDSDEGIARNALTAFDGFQQKRRAFSAQFEVQADGRLQVGGDFTDDGLDGG